MLLGLLAVFSIVSHTECVIRCFECTDTPHPADCTITTVCPDDQWCGTSSKREVNQSLSKRADLETCQECCSDDFCNNQGCGVIALTQPERGPYCYNCPVLEDPAACRTVKSCQAGAMCVLRDVGTSSASGNRIYASYCSTSYDCHHPGTVPIGKRDIVSERYARSTCTSCCNTDFCNSECGVIHTSVTNPASTASTTELVTTKPTTTHSQATGPAHCTAHGYHYKASVHLCYKFHLQKEIWQDANAICKYEGGTLAIIDSSAKWNYLLQRMKAMGSGSFHGNRIYFGMWDANKDNKYHWYNDVVPVHFTAWAHGEPDHGVDKCVAIDPRDHYLWHDDHCERTHYFVCSKQL